MFITWRMRSGRHRKRKACFAVLNAASLIAIGAAALPATAVSRSASTPSTGDYWGEVNGVTASFQVIRKHGKLKARYIAIAGANGDLFGALGSCKPPYATLTPTATPTSIKGGSFGFPSGAHGHFVTAHRATGTYVSGDCKVHWSARRVQRHSVKDGSWVGSTSAGPVKFSVSASGREAAGQFMGMFGSGCNAFSFAILIDPGGRFAGAVDYQWPGFHYGADYEGRFSSATTAQGTLTGTFDCTSAALPWSAQR